MPKIIQRYLAYNFIPPFLMSCLFFVAFLLTFQLFRIIRIVINKGVEFSTVFGLMGHIAISFLPMAVPLSVLFATIYTMNKLSEDSEVVAMRSFGLTKQALFMPFLVIGFLIASSIFVLNQNIIPNSKTTFKNTIIKMTSSGMLTNIKAGNFFTEIPNITLFAEKVSDDGNKLEDVFIRLKKNGLEQVILAEHGALIKQQLGKLTTPSLRLHLTNGNITKTKEKDKDVEKIIFEEYDFPVLEGGGLPGFVTKDSMRTNSELSAVIETNKEKIRILSSKKNLQGNEAAELNRLKDALPSSQMEYWSRLNTPIQVLLFILLGFSIGIKKGRGRTKNSGALGISILALYYILFFGGISLSSKGKIPPAMAIAFPSVVLAFVDVYYFRKLDWFS